MNEYDYSVCQTGISTTQGWMIISQVPVRPLKQNVPFWASLFQKEEFK